MVWAKTTFLRMLLGEEAPDSGAFDIGTTVRFGYYRQQAPDFAPDKRVIDVVQDIAERFEGLSGERQTLTPQQLLTQFLFPPERQYSVVGKLSGGELRRLYLCTVLATQPNFLVLDEPTNDLDIHTLQVLEAYLADFGGCVIIVSHDRFFMDKVVEHLLCFEGEGKVRDFPGNYSLYRAWQEHQEEQRREAEAERQKKQAPTQAEPTKPRSHRPPRLSYAEQRELQAIEERLKFLEEERSHLEEQMSRGDLQGEELIRASERIGAIMEEQDELVLRQLELEDKVS